MSYRLVHPSLPTRRVHTAWRACGLYSLLLLLLALAGSCGSDGGDASDPSASGPSSDDPTDVSDTSGPDPDPTEDVSGTSTNPTDVGPDPSLPAVNACGGEDALQWEGADATPGDACGPFGEGTLVCGATDILRCVGQAAVNLCGTLGELPVEIGSPCGVCAGVDDDLAGTWVCGEDGTPTCIGGRDSNACGGCAALDARPGALCNDGDGRWVCSSREELTCFGIDSNACGGTGVLRLEDGQPALPGEACEATCGPGVLVCSDENAGSLECVSTDEGLPPNACGGCDPLPGAVGEACGLCSGGTWACDGEGGLSCLGATPPDACGGCTDRTERPGQPCEVDGIWLCAGSNLSCGTVVRPEDRNACGGAESLPEQPGTACGTCGDGLQVCVTPNTVDCLGGEALNACGGCGPLRGAEGQACGECGSGSLACATDDTVLECQGDLGADARNACGRCAELPVDLGDACGTCLEWTCGPTGGVRCELNATLPGCNFDTCASLDCAGENRSCIPSDGSSNATCDICLKGFVEQGGVCVEDDGTPPTAGVLCVSDADCAGSEVCDDGACVPAGSDPGGTDPGGTDPGGTDPDGTYSLDGFCNDDDDCAAGELCSWNECFPAPADGAFEACSESAPCPSGTVCVDFGGGATLATCLPECTEEFSQEECPLLRGEDGFEVRTTCTESSGTLLCRASCWDGCPVGMECADPQNVCMAATCTADDQCDGDAVCNDGECGCADPNLTLCGDRCVDTQTSAENCGACGTDCGAFVACEEGTCGDFCDEPNGCQGCNTLEAGPGDSCGECGTFACDGRESLVCIDPGFNACGGCSELDGRPGAGCGPCGDGVFQCAGDGASVICAGATTSCSWAEVSAGSYHACAITDAGTLFCWGLNDTGNLGNGTVAEGFAANPVPRLVRAAESADETYWTDWISVSTGYRTTCGVRGDGSLWCWGDGFGGGLGAGPGVGAEPVPLPVPVVDAEGTGVWTDWVSVSVGDASACGIRADGSLWCWGRGAAQRGAGEDAPNRVYTPVAVMDSSGTGLWTDWVSVRKGRVHTCGLRENGRLFCWGTNSSGQLGLGSTDELVRYTPGVVVPMEGDTGPPWQDWTDFDVGPSYTCGVREEGSLWCWGTATLGVLGNAATEGNFAHPVQVLNADGDGVWTDWQSLAAAAQSNETTEGVATCGVRDGGSLWCWGRNGQGSLGAPVSGVSALPVQVINSDSDGVWTDWSSVSSGSGFACGLRDDDSLWCWGRNAFGELGNTGDSTIAPRRALDPGAEPED